MRQFRCALLILIPGIAVPSVLADAPSPSIESQSRIKVPEGPDDRHFVLKIETINANGKTTDDRRFTLLALGKKRFQFRIGGSGIATSGIRDEKDPPKVHRLDARLTLKLNNNQIVRTMKFHRGRGGSIGTAFPAPNLNSLKGVVNLQLATGRYPVGKRVVIGHVQGKELSVTVR